MGRDIRNLGINHIDNLTALSSKSTDTTAIEAIINLNFRRVKLNTKKMFLDSSASDLLASDAKEELDNPILAITLSLPSIGSITRNINLEKKAKGEKIETDQDIDNLQLEARKCLEILQNPDKVESLTQILNLRLNALSTPYKASGSFHKAPPIVMIYDNGFRPLIHKFLIDKAHNLREKMSPLFQHVVNHIKSLKLMLEKEVLNPSSLNCYKILTIFNEAPYKIASPDNILLALNLVSKDLENSVLFSNEKLILVLKEISMVLSDFHESTNEVKLPPTFEVKSVSSLKDEYKLIFANLLKDGHLDMERMISEFNTKDNTLNQNNVNKVGAFQEYTNNKVKPFSRLNREKKAQFVFGLEYMINQIGNTVIERFRSEMNKTPEASDSEILKRLLLNSSKSLLIILEEVVENKRIDTPRITDEQEKILINYIKELKEAVQEDDIGKIYKVYKIVFNSERSFPLFLFRNKLIKNISKGVPNNMEKMRSFLENNMVGILRTTFPYKTDEPIINSEFSSEVDKLFKFLVQGEELDSNYLKEIPRILKLMAGKPLKYQIPKSTDFLNGKSLNLLEIKSELLDNLYFFLYNEDPHIFEKQSEDYSNPNNLNREILRRCLADSFQLILNLPFIYNFCKAELIDLNANNFNLRKYNSGELERDLNDDENFLRFSELFPIENLTTEMIKLRTSKFNNKADLLGKLAFQLTKFLPGNSQMMDYLRNRNISSFGTLLNSEEN